MVARSCIWNWSTDFQENSAMNNVFLISFKTSMDLSEEEANPQKQPQGVSEMEPILIFGRNFFFLFLSPVGETPFFSNPLLSFLMQPLYPQYFLPLVMESCIPCTGLFSLLFVFVLLIASVDLVNSCYLLLLWLTQLFLWSAGKELETAVTEQTLGSHPGSVVVYDL